MESQKEGVYIGVFDRKAPVGHVLRAKAVHVACEVQGRE
jgi:hypothetical protein